MKMCPSSNRNRAHHLMRVLILCCYLSSRNSSDAIYTGTCLAHERCDLDSYCGQDTGWKEAHCLRCGKCFEPSSYGGIPPIDGTCPKKCSCQNHHDDCPGTANTTFCGQHNICAECKYCDADRLHRLWSNTDPVPCPEYCFCQSSEDCEVGYFCKRGDLFGEFTGDNICRPCTSMECSDQLTTITTTMARSNSESTTNISNTETIMTPAEQLQERCKDICPEEYECGSHEDCDTEMGQWCTINHQCEKDCASGACSNTEEAFEYYSYEILPEGLAEHPHIGTSASLSIDSSCPENDCCNWQLPPPPNSDDEDFSVRWYPSHEKLLVSRCNSEDIVEAYFVRRDEGNLQITAQDLVNNGKRCDSIQIEIDSHVVTEIKCNSAGLDECYSRGESKSFIVGVVVSTSTKNNGDDNNNVDNEIDSVPVYIDGSPFSQTTSKCYDDSVGGFGIFVGIMVFGGLGGLCLLYIGGRCLYNKYRSSLTNG